MRAYRPSSRLIEGLPHNGYASWPRTLPSASRPGLEDDCAWHSHTLGVKQYMQLGQNPILSADRSDSGPSCKARVGIDVR